MIKITVELISSRGRQYDQVLGVNRSFTLWTLIVISLRGHNSGRPSCPWLLANGKIK